MKFEWIFQGEKMLGFRPIFIKKKFKGMEGGYGIAGSGWRRSYCIMHYSVANPSLSYSTFSLEAP